MNTRDCGEVGCITFNRELLFIAFERVGVRDRKKFASKRDMLTFDGIKSKI